MKFGVCLALVSVLGVQEGTAQALWVGFTGGLSFADLSGPDLVEGQAAVALAEPPSLVREAGTFAVLMRYQANPAVALQTEARLSRRGGGQWTPLTPADPTLGQPLSVQHMRAEFLSVPLLARFTPITGPVRPYLLTGAAVDFELSCEFDSRTQNATNRVFAPNPNTGPGGCQDSSPPNLSIHLGSGVDFSIGAGTATAGVRFEAGLGGAGVPKLSGFRRVGRHHRVFSLVVGYAVSLR